MMWSLVRRSFEQSTARARATLIRSRTTTALAVLLPFCFLLLIFQSTSVKYANDYEVDQSDFNEISKVFLNDSNILDSIGPQFAAMTSQKRKSCTCIEEPKESVGANDNSSVIINSITSTSSSSDLTSTMTKMLDDQLPIIYLITPTYTRPTQMPDLTRMAQTLMLVRQVFWIVVEDASSFSGPVRQLLIRSGVPFAHLLGPRPATHMDARSGRGVSNRLRALKYLRRKFASDVPAGVLYFADDDNAYDIRLFDEIRRTRRVSVFPVGGIDRIGLSSPVLDAQTQKVIAFHDPFISQRLFAVDMAGFAVNLAFFLSKPTATMPYKVGYEEDFFIRSLGVTLNDLEPLAQNCTQILVWHTRTRPVVGPSLAHLKKEWDHTNLPLLYHRIMDTKL